MFRIDRNTMKTEADKTNAKQTPGNTVQIVSDSFKNGVWNVIDTISSFDAYEMANWIIGTDRWIQNRTMTENTTTYKRGTIVWAELGGDNFKYEPSFEHPCVVLFNSYNRIWVVPASSGRYRCGYRDVIDVRASRGGFLKNSGIQMESARWIHKNRVTGILGKCPSPEMQKIDDYLLNQIPTSRRQTSIIGFLQNDINARDMQIAGLQADVASRDSQIVGLQTDLAIKERNMAALTESKQKAVDRIAWMMNVIRGNPDFLRILQTEAEKQGIEAIDIVEEAN